MTPINPTTPQRFPDRPLNEAAERWWVAKVKPRQEKLLATDFFKTGIEYYLPLYTKNTPRPGTTHKRIFHVPLFPGYIAFAQDQPHNIYLSGRVVNLIEIKHQQRFIREMNQIYFALQGNAPLEPAPDAFTEGTPVKIIHGPFRGIEGIVTKDTASLHLILSVEGLGKATLKVDRTWIKEIEDDC
jgi:transcription antitermination factor NusG